MRLTNYTYCLIALAFVLLSLPVKAQDKWDLKKCIEYAWEHAISVKQADIQARVAELTFQQNKLSQYPSVNLSNATGTNFGRAVDPTSNLFISSTLLFQQYNMNVSGLIYNWGNLRHTILSADYGAKAAKKEVDRIKNDIGLTTATTYLQVLLSKEQVRIAKTQMGISWSRLLDTRKRVDAGLLPELNALEIEAQYARDSAAYITSITLMEQNRITLKATINLDAAAPFDIEEPAAATIPVESIESLTPDMVYAIAIKTQPQQQVNDLRIKSLQYGIKAAKAGLYPTLSWFGGLGTNFANPNVKIAGINFLGYRPVSAFSPVVNIGGTPYPVLEPNIELVQSKKSIGQMWQGWGAQIGNNFRQNFGLQLSVPLFNGGQARTAYKRVQYDLQNAELVKEQANLRLKNDIYLAYQAAVNAKARFEASQKTETISKRAFDLAQKRYDSGLLQSIEWINTQNNWYRAQIQVLADQYDFVFRMKVLEFYKGLGLRLE